MWLSGKKTSIATIISAILVLFIGRGYIPQDVAQMITIILAALGITANVATKKLFKK